MIKLLKHKLTHRGYLWTAILCVFLFNGELASNDLPSIGGTDTISYEQEAKLGQAWLRLFRRSAPLTADPILVHYTENLLANLAKHTNLEDKSLSLVLVNNPEMNAFAVPGGIIGIHTGLFRYAENEAQFASVITHELAHLTQRHYARGVESTKGQGLANLAGLLAGLVLLANNQVDAGAAAITTTQASAIDQQLRFSRTFEEEADRLGIQTLVKAGYAPDAMSAMFSHMMAATRFSTQPPEFFLTHPLTAKRLADAENRVRSFKSDNTKTNSLDYDLARARVLVALSPSTQHAIKRFEAEIKGISPSEIGSRYGLVAALIKDQQYQRAKDELDGLKLLIDDHPTIRITESEILSGLNQMDQAISLIISAKAIWPNHYALSIQHARLLATKQDYNESAALLSTISKERTDDPHVWYHLAEISGLANDILSLHQARAEYFILVNDFKSARTQLNNVKKKFADNEEAVRSANIRLKDIKLMEKVKL